jgi:tetratricopeptide (TPR) repeat protein
MSRLRRLASGLVALAACAVLSPVSASDLEDGLAALRAKRWAEAAAALERATAATPTDVEAWFRLGMARAGLDDHDGAIAAYTRALELDPRHTQAWNNLANVHYRRGDIERAAEAYGRAVAIDPGYLLAVYHHGWMLRQLNRSTEAEEAFAHCLGLQPSDDRERKTQLDCLFYLGTLRFRAADWTAAAQAMERVVGTVPNHREAHYYLGMAYRRLGRDEAAREQLELHRRLLADSRSSDVIRRRDEP